MTNSQRIAFWILAGLLVVNMFWLDTVAGQVNHASDLCWSAGALVTSHGYKDAGGEKAPRDWKALLESVNNKND